MNALPSAPIRSSAVSCKKRTFLQLVCSPFHACPRTNMALASSTTSVITVCSSLISKIRSTLEKINSMLRSVAKRSTDEAYLTCPRACFLLFACFFQQSFNLFCRWQRGQCAKACHCYSTRCACPVQRLGHHQPLRKFRR